MSRYQIKGKKVCGCGETFARTRIEKKVPEDRGAGQIDQLVLKRGKSPPCHESKESGEICGGNKSCGGGE